jgi:hypothetical protein
VRFPTVLLLVAVLLVSCKGDQQPVVPVESRSISGVILLYDAKGVSPFDPTVSIMLDRALVTTSTGQWMFDRLWVGEHKIEFSKQGFGIVKHTVDLSLVDPSPDTIRMSEPPAFNVMLETLEFLPDSNILHITGTGIGGDLSNARVLFSVSRDSEVEISQSSSIVVPLNSNVFDLTGPSRESLVKAGFNGGETVYVAAYPLGWHDDSYSAYYDPATRKYIYSALGVKSNVLSIQIP